MQTILSFRATNVVGLAEKQIKEKEHLYKKLIADENENTLEEYYFLSDESLEAAYFFEYNDKGQMISLTQKDDEDEIVELRTFEYNDKGLLVKELLHYTDETADEITYAYNEDGFPLSKTSIDSEGEKGNYHKFEYKNGKIVAENEYDAKDKLLTSSIIIRDEQNRAIEEIIKNHEETYRHVYEYNDSLLPFLRKKYNAKNQLIERIFYTYTPKGDYAEIKTESAESTNITIFEYDENGNVLIQEEKKSEGELKSKIIQTFDHTNRLLTTVFTGISGYNQATLNYRIRNEYY